MKRWAKSSEMLAAIIVGLFMLRIAGACAQAYSYANLHSFSGYNNGQSPRGALVLSGGTLYGTTSGDFDNLFQGTIFSINTDGTGLTTLHNFAGDGHGEPWAGLLLSSNTLYGTTAYGGILGQGSVFAIHTDGTGFTNLHSFADGSSMPGPFTGLIFAGSTLYGTTIQVPPEGCVYSLKPDATAFTILHTFSSDCFDCFGESWSRLVSSGNTLYGTTAYGGLHSRGAIFKINTDGTGFTNFYAFSAPSDNSLTNADGAHPRGALLLVGDTLYGTASEGGPAGSGTVFSLKTDGTSFKTLHEFLPGGITPSGQYTNLDGAHPYAGLILSGYALYGTTFDGGVYGCGTVFKLNADGTDFINLHTFRGYPNDGDNPWAELILAGSTLYGTTYGGGTIGAGTIFSILLPPQLMITSSGTNLALMWPTNATGFTLQTCTNLASPAWVKVSSPINVLNGQNNVTNPVSGTQQFYRLSR